MAYERVKPTYLHVLAFVHHHLGMCTRIFKLNGCDTINIIKIQYIIDFSHICSVYLTFK